MRLCQYRETGGRRAVAVLDKGRAAAQARRLQDAETIYELALEAAETGQSLRATALAHGTDADVDLDEVAAAGRLLPPLEHPVPTRCWITGSETATAATPDEAPSWFFRGNGASLVGSGQPLPLPEFALGALEQPRLVGVYLIGDDGVPCGLGWALGNDLVDRRLQQRRPDQLAHARLRPSAIGPELLLGDLPRSLAGTARVLRGPRTVRERPFAAGQAALGLPIASIERSHFRYPMFRRPGDVHLHFLGGDEAVPAGDDDAQAGDVFEIQAPPFRLALRNPLVAASWTAPAVKRL
jgi:hypothetical protein